MARVLSGGTNKINIFDTISNSTIQFEYTTPTTAQIKKYNNNAIKRVRNKIINRTAENRIESALDIITGFRKGDFLKPVKDGDGKIQHLSFSANQNDSDYDPNWKSLIEEFGSDLLTAFSIAVFEGSEHDGEEASKE